MPVKKAPFLTKPYGGYLNRDVPKDDKELTRVGPGTPMGEYLRRFWQPLLLSEQITDLPVAITRFGEELVAFRDGGLGESGSLKRTVRHRGTSLEYGKVEQRGIRCCYHGWLFDADGTILETPGEPENSTLKDRLCHGAYPAIEYCGLVFAYMGPPDETPEFPNFDIFTAPGHHLEPGVHLMPTEDGIVPNPKPCNWMHVVDNLLDPIHEEFLHATISGIQFVDKSGVPIEELAINGELGFCGKPHGRDNHGCASGEPRHRVGAQHRVCLAQRGCPRSSPDPALRVGTRRRGVPRPAHHHNVGRPRRRLQLCGDRLLHSARRRKSSSREAIFSGAAGKQEAAGSYDDMQRGPGDFEAMVSQRPISVHALEHLGVEDRGITMYRKGLRHRVRMLKNGEAPPEIGIMAGQDDKTPTVATPF